MVKLLRNCLLGILLATTSAFAQIPKAVEGDWMGGYELNGHWSLMSLDIRRTPVGLAATVRFQQGRSPALGADHFAVKSSHIQFQISTRDTDMEFVGELQSDQIRGRVIAGGHQGTFQLLPSVTMDRKALAEYEGTYEWGSHHFVDVHLWSELGKNQLGMFDESGQIRALYPMRPDEFFVGEGLHFPVPLEAILQFHRNRQDRIISLVWRSAEGVKRTAPVAHLETSTPISFNNGNVRLAGSLITPLLPGPHPALVVVQGSGPQDRTDSLPFVHFLVRHGFALLVYDKRGVGESSGDWKRSSFQDLADDAVAAVHFLQGRPEIDSHYIGIFGVSQGGWIGPLTAARYPDVAFVVSVSGPGVTPGQETLDFIQGEMQADGLSRNDIAEATRLTRLYFDFARTGQHWDSYWASRQKDVAQPWLRFMDLPSDPHAWEREFWRLNADYDPVTTLSKVRCPVLAFFGGIDLNVVAEKNLPIWDSALKNGANRDYLLTLVGKGNHILVQGQTGSVFEFPHLQTMAPDYFRVLLDWLEARTKATTLQSSNR